MAQGALCSFSFGTGPREDQGDGRMAHRWEWNYTNELQIYMVSKIHHDKNNAVVDTV